MDPISLILGAILVGVAKGSGDVASGAVVDAYNGFREALRRRLAGREPAQAAVEGYTADPDNWRPALEAYLQQADAQRDEVLLASASAVLSTADPAGASRGKYAVQIYGAQGVQVGDRNIQTNNYRS
ncbi:MULTISPECIES: RIP homotypic interaction motif-containing protein [unclassified Streptomyces]|uniref:RIP homotypic interaction motif-containing protein n=1 Tax=unclassified Streptomyces TaxID=2593676 RepID=UPI001BB0CD3E|nr:MULTISPECIES: RIP homotypic interaction motif-containing protein [unclassified Streptomyces]WKX19495.1 RIP homotypic interaction motif-containing protein [Streptomyces sp. HUAS CX7]